MQETTSRIYLDHAATTYLDPEVKKEMEPYWDVEYGNPSSLHSFGLGAKKALDHARNRVAVLLNSSPSEIIFTAGGTESINLALFGIAGLHDRENRPHIITSKIEHQAVLNCCKLLETRGYEVSYLQVNDEGFVDLEELKGTIKPETIMISVMYANNEIGVIEPIMEIAAYLKKLNEKRKSVGCQGIIFHTDACQAGGLLGIDTRKLAVDLMTLNGSKIYGPKQTGILYVREGVRLLPLLYGGGQERNLRSGTENVAGIMGFAKALEIAQLSSSGEAARLQELCEYTTKRIREQVPNCMINGPRNYKSRGKMKRLPNNINISFSGVDGELLAAYLDNVGICVSTGSACASKNNSHSHVLEATGCPEDYRGGSIRVTLGKSSNKNQMDYLVRMLVEGVRKVREATKITTELKQIKGKSIGSNCIEMG